MNVKEEIFEFIVENFLFGEENDFKSDTNVFDKGIVDSTGVLEILSYLEDTYDIVVEDDDVTQSNFSSVDNISSYLLGKLNGKGEIK